MKPHPPALVTAIVLALLGILGLGQWITTGTLGWGIIGVIVLGLAAMATAIAFRA